MIQNLSKENFQLLEKILNEKLSYIILNKRNLFNFECLDKIQLDIKEMIKNKNTLIFNNYNNIYQVIDNFENNIEKYIENKLKELGD